jgi:molybdopterin-guanine dinucleotide biosynthesis protein A
MRNSPPLRAVVTAGGRVDPAFADAIGTPFKALAPLGSRLLLDRVLEALGAAGIGEVAVIAEPAVAEHAASRGARAIAADPDGATNVLRALDAWPEGDLLYATCDLPFITGAALDALLTASEPYDLTLPLAAADAYAAAYPGAAPHATALGGERVVNGSVFVIRRVAVAPVRRVAGAFFDARKSPLGMARLLGPGLLTRFVLRRLRIADVEGRATKVLGVHAAAVRDQSPALCYDVDSLDDYTYACRQQP